MILVFLVIGWILGIAAASFLKVPTYFWLLMGAVFLIYLAVFWRSFRLRQWHFVLLAFVFGALRLQLALPGELDLQLANFNEQGRASLIGLVVAEPDVRETQTLVQVQASKIQTDGVWLDTNGLALVAVPRDTQVSYGDEVQVEGSPTTPPDGKEFSYRDYLARQNVFTFVRNARLYTITPQKHRDWLTPMLVFKEDAKAAIVKLFPEPSAALLTGILLGDDKGMPKDLDQAFINTNTAHIIAISGFNIAVLVSVLTLTLRRPVENFQALAATTPGTSNKRQLAISVSGVLVTFVIIAILILYALLVGASASVVRACIMGALAIVALQFGRTGWVIVTLAFAGFLMTIWNPYVLWDVGFQLSFLATLGLVVYAPRLNAWWEERLLKKTNRQNASTVLNFMHDGFIVTTAAFLVTAPLLVLYFHRIAPIGFLTNFLVLPVQPFIMILGGAATLLQMLANAVEIVPMLSLVFGGLAQVVAWGAYLFLQYTILVVQATAAIPFGSFEIEGVDLPIVVLFYAGLGVITWLGVKRTVRIVLSQSWIFAGLAASATILVWVSAVAIPSANTQLHVLRARDREATFVRAFDDYRILINGTGEPNTLVSFLGNQLPPWDRRIDLVIATQLDDGNLSALNAVLERFDVGTVLEPPQPARPGTSYMKWRNLIEERDILAHVTQTGTVIKAGETAILILSATDDDGKQRDMVLQLDVNGKHVLIAPTLSRDKQKELVESQVELAAEAAVLPQGVEPSFLSAVAPKSVVMIGRQTAGQVPGSTIKIPNEIGVVKLEDAGQVQLELEND